MKKPKLPISGKLTNDDFRKRFGNFLSDLFESPEVECSLTQANGKSTIRIEGGNTQAIIHFNELKMEGGLS